MRPLLLTHVGVVSCLGAGQAETLRQLRRGESGLRPCDFEGAALETHIGRVTGLETAPILGVRAPYDCRNHRLAQRALERDGFVDAVIRARGQYGAHRIGVFAGTSTAGILESEQAFRRRDPDSGALPPEFRYREQHNTYSIADFLQQTFALTGPALVVSAACASTAKVFGVAARMIALDLCDAAIVGGADSLCLTTLYGFNALQLTSTRPCRPFDVARDGISIGEAAGFVLVERDEPNARGANIRLLGVGESSDAYHMSSPHPDGLGARQAMQAALSSAGLGPQAIDYINIHGTATKAGDLAEDHAVSTLFGRDTPCTSTKGLTGHTLGASGVLEVILSMLALRHAFIPASPTTQNLDPELRSRYLQAGQDLPLTHVMTNSFGFGGSNCSLILGRTG